MSGGEALTYWVDDGNTVRTAAELQELVGAMRADVHHMRTGLARAAWGALHGQPWANAPVEGGVRPDAEAVLEQLRMSVVPAGMTAKEATHRQSLAVLLTALDAVDEASLVVWLAGVTVDNPNRPA
ncbi:hypothetical protein [Streptomyces sp. NPDC088794]|uniref:hypothetical protein n=1 Tax=Streptomyces sp. NPDC088794 TaxID=3365902 RepID=UPI0037F1FF9D